MSDANRPSIYLETTIFGYLAMRPSKLLRVAANQESTRDWWDNHRHRYEPFVSQYVVDECLDGDPIAAQERAVFLDKIPLLKTNNDGIVLAQSLIDNVPIPPKAALDAYHISVAAVHGIEYLMTWNCKHIANALLRSKIVSLCRQAGFECPIICTPQEILEINDVI